MNRIVRYTAKTLWDSNLVVGSLLRQCGLLRPHLAKESLGDIGISYCIEILDID